MTEPCCPHCEKQYRELLEHREARIAELQVQLEAAEERSRLLLEAKNHWVDRATTTAGQVEELVEELVEALRWYANEENWEEKIAGIHGQSYSVQVGDGGEHARALLQRVRAKP
jgi:hypothetical protein